MALDGLKDLVGHGLPLESCSESQRGCLRPHAADSTLGRPRQINRRGPCTKKSSRRFCAAASALGGHAGRGACRIALVGRDFRAARAKPEPPRHRFGGSVSAVAILAAWSVLFVRMQARARGPDRDPAQCNELRSADHRDFTASATARTQLTGRGFGRRWREIARPAYGSVHGSSPRRARRRAGRGIRSAADLNATQE